MPYEIKDRSKKLSLREYTQHFIKNHVDNELLSTFIYDEVNDVSDTEAVRHNLTTLSMMSRFLYDIDVYQAGTYIANMSFMQHKILLGSTHPDTLKSRSLLSLLLIRSDDFNLLGRLNKEKNRDLNSNQLDSLIYQAGSLEIEGIHNASEVIYQQEIEIAVKLQGNETSESLDFIMKLAANLNFVKKDYDAAELIYKQVIHVSKRINGADHLDTLHYRTELAQMYQAKGDYHTAESLYHQLLKDFEHILGVEHLETLNILTELAGLLNEKGDEISAKPLYLQILNSYEQRLGCKHQKTHAVLRNLAQLPSMSDFESTISLLKIHQRILGHGAPETLVCYQKLGNFYFKKGDYIKAEPIYNHLLSVHKKTLGRKHPKTITCISNLAITLGSMGQYQTASPLFQRALNFKKKTLGHTHPKTIHSLSWLTWNYFRMGEYKKSEPLHRKLIAYYEKNVETNETEILRYKLELAFILQKIGKTQDEKRLLQAIIVISRRTNDTDKLSSALRGLGMNLYNTEEYLESIQCLQESANILRKSVNNTTKNKLISTLEKLLNVLEKTKEPHKIKKIQHEIKTLQSNE
jgi:tetratricopeptide (TPR) repeat protein